MAEDQDRGYWQAQARRLSLQVNLGWWLETMAMPMVAGSVVLAAVLLIVRRMYPQWGYAEQIGGCAAAFILLALVCWRLARRRFESPGQSLVRLEASMAMNNALSAADAGISPWPSKKEAVQTGLLWHWPRVIVPPVGALALVAAGLFIPISGQVPRTSPAEEPQSWKQLSAEMDRLAEEKVVDESYLEEMKKKLEELKSQEEEQWFSHSSLEATDTLKKNHAAETERVEQELAKAQKAVDQLEKMDRNASAQEKKGLLDEFQQSLQGLQNGAMKPNPQLLEQMKQLNPENFGKLTPEQMQQLKENLQKHSQAMKKGKGQGEGDDWSDELLSGEDGQDGQGKGKGRKPGTGKGGINRGPGHDPDVLGEEKEGVDVGSLTAMEAKDLSRATPGDLLQLQDGEHDVDPSGSKLSDGGITDATGKGGDRVWRESLDPAEQRAVKRFFE